MVFLHRATGAHERSEPGLLLHALRDGTLALPAIVAAVWLGGAIALTLLDRRRQLPDPWRSALLATGAALAAAVVLAAGNPIHGLLFEASEATGLSPALHLGRDFLFAMSAALPIAAALLALPAAWRPALPPAPGGSLTRRGFVAGGLATAGVAGVVLTRTPRPAGAQVATDRLHLYINEGHVAMVDGTLVYMRGYGATPSGDPRPSLRIEPQLFLRDRAGPVASPTTRFWRPSRSAGLPPPPGLTRAAPACISSGAATGRASSLGARSSPRLAPRSAFASPTGSPSRTRSRSRAWWMSH